MYVSLVHTRTKKTVYASDSQSSGQGPAESHETPNRAEKQKVIVEKDWEKKLVAQEKIMHTKKTNQTWDKHKIIPKTEN